MLVITANTVITASLHDVFHASDDAFHLLLRTLQTQAT
jgi:hypothetical protein